MAALPPAAELAPQRPSHLTPAVEGLGDGLPMLNEPVRDFSQAAQRAKRSPGPWPR